MKKNFIVGFIMLHIITVNIFAYNNFVQQHTLQHNEVITHHEHHHHHKHASMDHKHCHSHTLIFADFFNHSALLYEVILSTEKNYYSFKEETPHFIPEDLLRPPIV